jgi:hypothetical protein
MPDIDAAVSTKEPRAGRGQRRDALGGESQPLQACRTVLFWQQHDPA